MPQVILISFHLVLTVLLVAWPEEDTNTTISDFSAEPDLLTDPSRDRTGGSNESTTRSHDPEDLANELFSFKPPTLEPTRGTNKATLGRSDGSGQLNAGKTQNKPVFFFANNLSANVPVTSKNTIDELDPTNTEKTRRIYGSAASVGHHIPTEFPMAVAHQLAEARTDSFSARPAAMKAGNLATTLSGVVPFSALIAPSEAKASTNDEIGRASCRERV